MSWFWKEAVKFYELLLDQIEEGALKYSEKYDDNF